MDYNNQHIADVNTESDVDSRLTFQQKLLEWSGGTLTALQSDVNFSPETHFLR
jgi:hypothetical protein